MSPACLLALGLLAAPTPHSLLGELERLDRALAEAEQRTAESELRRQRLDEELAALETRIATTRVKKQDAFARFRDRLSALARMPSGARMILLGGVDSLADYLRMSRTLRWIARHDRTLEARYVAEADRLRAMQAALEHRKAQLAELETTLRQERDAIAEERQARLALLESISSQRDLAVRAATERTEARRELAAMVKRLRPVGPQREAFRLNAGRLPWPTAGEVSRRFGQEVESEFGSKTLANGVDIRAAAGSEVQAIADGEVVYADWLRGYGLVVILDHGEGYHTVMAHLASAAVSVGDSVHQGERVGTVGDTGSLRGTLLYFEVRENGTPVDPLRWLRR